MFGLLVLQRRITAFVILLFKIFFNLLYACIPGGTNVLTEKEVLKFLHMLHWKKHGLFGILYNQFWQLLHCQLHTCKTERQICWCVPFSTLQLYSQESTVVEWKPFQASLIFYDIL